MKTQHLLIHGRVQGVWFRESMRSEAERLGVTGWVRNRPDGTVEAVIQGADEALGILLDWTHRGPPAARVTRVIVSDAEGHFSAFEKRA